MQRESEPTAEMGSRVTGFWEELEVRAVSEPTAEMGSRVTATLYTQSWRRLQHQKRRHEGDGAGGHDPRVAVGQKIMKNQFSALYNSFAEHRMCFNYLIVLEISKNPKWFPIVRVPAHALSAR